MEASCGVAGFRVAMSQRYDVPFVDLSLALADLRQPQVTISQVGQSYTNPSDPTVARCEWYHSLLSVVLATQPTDHVNAHRAGELPRTFET